MWIVTIFVGGVFICIYIIKNYIFENCYLFKQFYKLPEIYLAKNFKGCVKAVTRMIDRHPRSLRVVGMDCEMTSTSVNGGHPVPAILQLASPDGFCAIFQLKVIERAADKIKLPYLSDCPKISEYSLPSRKIISQVLEDPNVLKVGVAVINDAKYLEESSGLFSKGCLDIRHLAKHAGIEPKGLNYLAKKVLGKEKLELKRKRVPWESETISVDQLDYAAVDARLGVEVFLELNKIVIERYYSWLRRLFWDENTYWNYSLKHWSNYIGEPFEFSTLESFENRNVWTSYIPGFASIFLCNLLDVKGAMKYVANIPESVNSSRRCYVCGFIDQGRQSIKLKAIVPVDYSVEFHDENLYYICLCEDCFEETRQKVDYKLRHELTEECAAPYPVYKNHRLELAKKVATEILSSAWDIQSSGQDKDNEWIKILEASLLELLPRFPEEELHIRSMEIILSMDCWPGSDHGRFVHDYFRLYGGGLNELRWRWCERFYRVMRPQHLPWVWQDFLRSDPRWHWIMT